jgi:IS1 family transposase
VEEETGQSGGEAEAGEFWVWVSFVPEHRLVLATHVGHHEQADAQQVVEKTKERLARPLPLFISDGWDAYIDALLGAFHEVRQRPRTGKPGRPPGPEMIPDQELRYAQLVKVREKGRVVGTHKRAIFGDEGAIDMDDVSTSLIERQNLSLRQDNRRISRKTNCFSKCVQMLNHQLTLYRVYFNFIKPHLSLRQPVNEKVVGKVRRKWCLRTPAMSAGITDHIWSLDVLLATKPILISTN